MHVLLVKTSSLGDVIHNLPVVSDLKRMHPEAQIDWCVEESCAAIPRLHPGVREVIPVALRRWRKTPFAAAVCANSPISAAAWVRNATTSCSTLRASSRVP